MRRVCISSHSHHGCTVMSPPGRWGAVDLLLACFAFRKHSGERLSCHLVCLFLAHQRKLVSCRSPAANIWIAPRGAFKWQTAALCVAGDRPGCQLCQMFGRRTCHSHIRLAHLFMARFQFGSFSWPVFRHGTGGECGPLNVAGLLSRLEELLGK